MTIISSKPNDDDRIVELKVDPLGNRYLVPTRLLITFWDDLVNSIKSITPSNGEDLNKFSEINKILRKLQDQEQRIDSKISYLESLLRSIRSDFKSFRSVSITSNYTARNYDWINVKSGATIKFPSNPIVNSEIIIRVGDDNNVPLDGNGKKINGSSTGRLYRKGTSIKFKYFIDENEWFAI